MTPGVATTEAEYTEVLSGGGSGGGGPQRLRGHAQVQHIRRILHECPGVIVPAHETSVREDLMTLPGGGPGAGNDTQENISNATVVISEFCELSP